VGAGSVWPINGAHSMYYIAIGLQIFNMHLTQGDGLKTASGVWSLDFGCCLCCCFPYISFEKLLILQLL